MGDEYGVTPGDYVAREASKGKPTNESAQAEWREKFGIENTKGWQALLEVDLHKAKNALQDVIDNRDHFPQYNDGWVFDRRKDLSRAELKAEFGIADTDGFRQALKDGKIEEAKKWMEGVIGYHETDPDRVAQYSNTWDEWEAYVKKELATTENKKKAGGH